MLFFVCHFSLIFDEWAVEKLKYGHKYLFLSGVEKNYNINLKIYYRKNYIRVRNRVEKFLKVYLTL